MFIVLRLWWGQAETVCGRVRPATGFEARTGLAGVEAREDVIPAALELFDGHDRPEHPDQAPGATATAADPSARPDRASPSPSWRTGLAAPRGP